MQLSVDPMKMIAVAGCVLSAAQVGSAARKGQPSLPNKYKYIIPQWIHYKGS